MDGVKVGLRSIAAVLVGALVVEPVDPAGGGHLDVLGGLPRLAAMDQFGVVQPDDDLAETADAAYKSEVIHCRKPWSNVANVELATARGRPGATKNARMKPSATSRQPSVEAALSRRLTPREPANSGPRNQLGTKPGVAQN